MKKVLIAASILAASSTSMAGVGAGCGVGAQLFKGQSGLVSHLAAATTNNTYSTNLTSIAFGIMGCNTNSPVVASVQGRAELAFVNSNADNLLLDMAKGSGETLDNFLELKKVATNDTDAVKDLLKASVMKLQGSDNVAVTENINAVLKASEYSYYSI